MKFYSKACRAVFCAVLLCAVLVAYGPAGAAEADPFSWPALDAACRPWSYWWWLGSGVDEESLSRLLEQYRDLGLGGMHVIPIYGVKGLEEEYLDYLSPAWLRMLEHTTREAKRLGMGIDMSTGTGWPFGGPWVDRDDAAMQLECKVFPVREGGVLKTKLPNDRVLCIMAYGNDGQRVDVTELLNGRGYLQWTAPGSGWKLYMIAQKPTGQQVKRAAPGAKGNVLDPFSVDAMERYLKRFDTAFAEYGGALPRAQYHDSYEYYHANCTDRLFEVFAGRRGYDLRMHLPLFLGEGPEEDVARVLHDYRQTAGEMHRDFIARWVEWAHRYGCLTRNQAHGAPANLLDVYGAADIPETEIFGPSGFPIPGLRMDQKFENANPHPLVLKFSSSAAHVLGRQRVSSETSTWLAEHFQVSLAQAKPEIDQLFACGINHIFYHGIAYSPPDAQWPAWQFYASTSFAPTNPFSRDFPALNAYAARCQSVLQAGQPDNDVLLYSPIHDVWQQPADKPSILQLSVHHLDWFGKGGLSKAAEALWELGAGFDYVSDAQLFEAGVEDGRVATPGGAYRALVVPNCTYMPLATMKKLKELVADGARVIFHRGLPASVPGYHEREARQAGFEAAAGALGLPAAIAEESAQGGVQHGAGHAYVAQALAAPLDQCGVARERLAEHGLHWIRRRHEEGHAYFIANLTAGPVDGWVGLGTKPVSAVLLDPMFANRAGKAALKLLPDGAISVYLQLKPGESRVLRTYTERAVEGPDWPYLEAVATDATPLQGAWRVEFVQGAPELPEAYTTTELKSWTERGGPAESFAGTARYTCTFNKPEPPALDWLLDLGQVGESARVFLNGKEIGVVFAHPFEIRLGNVLKDGENRLDIEVTNLGANRIRHLDRAGVEWRIFHDINFVNIRYDKFDASDWPLMPSGLMGPVRLLPMRAALAKPE